jgi:hypothetical protein
MKSQMKWTANLRASNDVIQVLSKVLIPSR